MRQIFSSNNQYYRRLWNSPLIEFLSVCILSVIIGYIAITQSPYLTISSSFVFVGLMILLTLVKNKATFVMLIFAIAPFTGLLKVFLNFKEFPLALDFLLMAVMGHAILQKVLSKYPMKIRMPYIGWLIMIFLFIAFLQMFNPALPNLMRGIYGFRASGAFYMLSFFVALLTVNKKEDILKIMKVFIITGFVVALYGIYQYINPSPEEMLYATRGEEWYGWHYLAKPFSTMIGPFHLGVFMALCSLTILTLLFKQNIIRMSKFNLRLIFIFLVVALLLSLTRVSYLALILGILSILFLKTKRERIKLKSMIRFVGVIIVILVILFLTTKIIPQSQMVLIRLSMLTNIEDSALQGRLTVWPVRVKQILQNSLGFGIGINSGENLFEASDNEFLAVGIETGWAGLFFFTLIIISILKKCFKLLKTLQDQELQVIAIWITSFIIALFSTMMTNHILQGYPINMYFWFMVGILYNLRYLDREKKENYD